MADQGRWFKLWGSALSDDALQALPIERRWAWAVLGVHTKVHGTRGRLTVSPTNVTLAAQMGIPVDALREVIATFPNVSISEATERRFMEGTNRHGAFTVTWANWTKYQEDSTRAERAKASRAKRRREEMRRDEKRTTPFGSSSDAHDSVPDDAPTNGHGPPVYRIPASVVHALDRAPVLGKVARLRQPSYWQAEVRANPGVDPAGEVLKAEAWMSSNPRRAPNRDLPRFLHNWLARAERGGEVNA
jgi:hypothetical protein